MYRRLPHSFALLLCMTLPGAGALADTGLRAGLFAAYGGAHSVRSGNDLLLGDQVPVTLRRWAPVPGRSAHVPREAILRIEGGDARARLRSLIASAEVGRAGYDAIQHGARRRPSEAPTRMTIGQIFDWVARTPGQPHAIGRYQFIPPTLRNLVRRSGLSRDTRFSPAVQDHLADLLLADAGIARFESGRLGRRDFMNNLARIWAGLPSSSGRSHYHGVAGNRATISWVSFERGMDAIYR